MASPDLPVTVEDLKILVPVTDSAAPIFIDSAHAIVEAKAIPQNYAPRIAYLIELYLAAHFTSFSDVTGSSGGMTRIVVGQSEESYSDPTKGNQGIANSKFGLQALSLDTLGLLSDLASSNIKAEFKVNR